MEAESRCRHPATAFSPGRFSIGRSFALINEGARALSSRDCAAGGGRHLHERMIPVVSRGSHVFADRVGLRTVCERVTAFFHELGKRGSRRRCWRPAGRAMTFRDYDAEREPDDGLRRLATRGLNI